MLRCFLWKMFSDTGKRCLALRLFIVFKQPLYGIVFNVLIMLRIILFVSDHVIIKNPFAKSKNRACVKRFV